MKTFKTFLESNQQYSSSKEEDISIGISEGESHKFSADPPAVLVMQRQAIRNYGNQKVALYYIKKLNKYVTVPYGHLNWATPLQAED